MPLIAGSLPPNTCYGTPQQLLDLFGSYLSLPGQNISLEAKVVTSNTTFGAGALGNTTPIARTVNVNVSGASLGDPVLLGFVAPATPHVLFDAWVSSANTVTIRCSYLVISSNAVAGMTFVIKVLKYGGTF